MIEVDKWEKMTDEQKLQMCESLQVGVNKNTISKGDWSLMFEFLMEKVKMNR